MRDSFRVHVRASGEPSWWRRFAAGLPEGVECSWGPEPFAAHEVDALIDGRPSAERLDACSALRALIIPYAGIPARTRALLLDRAIAPPTYNIHHNAEAVAEAAMALLFAAAKCVVPMDRRLRAGDWRPRYLPDPGVPIAGRTALVLGFGHIGRALVPKLRGVGLQVRALRRREGAAFVDGVTVSGPSGLDASLAASDFVICALPATAETRGLLTAERLGRLPEHAVIVNVGRHDVFDEEALYAALASGRLHSAALDVWANYPPSPDRAAFTFPSDLPFHELDNVVLSPHRTGHGEHVEDARADALLALVRALHRGDASVAPLDVERGY